MLSFAKIVHMLTEISKLQKKEKKENINQSLNACIVNMAILNTRSDIYIHRQDGSTMNIMEILRLMYN